MSDRRLDVVRDYPVREDDDARAVRQGQVQIMSDGDTELATLRFRLQDFEAMQLVFDIKEGGGLIKQ